MSDEATTALATTDPPGATPSDSSITPSPALDSDIRPPFFPMSMVVHGGTGIMHGNMTSLTVNQYIGVTPERGAFDSGKVKELMADAVRVSTDANSQLSDPEPPPTSYHTSGFPSDFLSKKGKSTSWWLLLGGLVVLCVVPLATMALYTKFIAPDLLMTPHQKTGTLSPSTEVGDYNVDPAREEHSLRILPRSFWLAQPPRGMLSDNTLPIRMVVVSDTRSEECFNSIDCVSQLRDEQLQDMDYRKLDDIAFNFLIGGDGVVYTGRGWDAIGAHTEGYDTGSLGVALIGTFSRTLPKDVQVKAFHKLVATGVETETISVNYTLVNRCQLRTDGYPNRALAMSMMSWPHFDISLPLTRCGLTKKEDNVHLPKQNSLP